MSYKKPKQWYLRLMKFFARCQTKTWKEQIEELGTGCLDFRLYWKDGELEYRHGCFRYDASDFWEVLDYCNQKKGMYIRVSLEHRKKKEEAPEDLVKKFQETCEIMQHSYQDITFFGGRNMGTWTKLYDFGNNPKIRECCSSTTQLISWLPKWIDDWCPWFYAKFKNKENLEKNKDFSGIVLFDFIEIK